mmetsp:Transcript_14132/g.36577  ORF Transcript_14132/g.36577 Transcript_14132/m.36577 type:complete len:202 (-) Transcript_14132:1095-1700(-)
MDVADDGADEVVPWDLLRKEIGHDHLRKGHVSHRNIEAVHTHLGVWLLLGRQHRHRHHQPLACELPAKHVADDAEHCTTRCEHPGVLAEAERLLETLAKLDEVVHLLQQLWADATEESGTRDRPPQLPPGDSCCVQRDCFWRKHSYLVEAGEHENHREPGSRCERYSCIRALHRHQCRTLAATKLHERCRISQSRLARDDR